MVTREAIPAARKTHDLQELHARLAASLQLVRQDRWIFGGLRDGRLRVIGDSALGTYWRSGRYRELSPMARRALFERSPVAFTSMLDVNEIPVVPDFETVWPSLLYVPIQIGRQRPCGLLIIGARVPVWYSDEDVDFVATVATMLSRTVQVITGPLGRLHVQERRAAELMSHGFSDDEIGAALGLTRQETATVIKAVTAKLALRSRRSINCVLPELEPSPGGYAL